MTRNLLFPGLLFTINIGAACVAFLAGDWRKGTYWIASAVCIAVIATQ